MNQNLRPAHVISPGRILERELKSRGWTQRDLAAIMDRPVQVINEIIRGNKQITPDTAIELAAALSTTPVFWTNLETSYRLHLAQQTQSDRDQLIARRSKLFSSVPLAELVRRSWIAATDDIDALEQAVCTFLGTSSLDEMPELSVAFRHAVERSPELNAKIAWVRRVELLGRTQHVGSFDPEQLRRAISNIVSCAANIQRIQEVPDMLRALGIRFVIVRHLPKTYIDGAVCDLQQVNPIVALTLRYDRVDSFWFTLLHELAHLVLGHQDTHLDDLDDQAHITAEQEQQANMQASTWLVDPRALETFVARTRPFFSRAKLLHFAAQQRIHPGIVVGQLQRRGELPYTHLRALLDKVSPYLTPWFDGGIESSLSA
jgi:HTH-type transcriptional regulator / antitoxin HigA